MLRPKSFLFNAWFHVIFNFAVNATPHIYHCNLEKNILILRSDTASQITPFSRECFLRYYGGQLKTAVEQEAGKKIDCKR